QQPGRKYRLGGRKCPVVGQEGNVVVRRNRFVALPDEASGHLFCVGVWDDHSLAQDKRIVVCRNHFVVQELIFGGQGNYMEIRKISSGGRKYHLDTRNIGFPVLGYEQEAHLHRPGVCRSPFLVQKNRILARRIVQV